MILIALRIAWPPASRSMMICPPRCIAIADDRNFEQLFFGDEPRLARHERRRGEDIEEALMIGNEDVRLQARKILKALDLHLDSADRDYPAPPRARDDA